jgi:hypothetical protein
MNRIVVSPLFGPFSFPDWASGVAVWKTVGLYQIVVRLQLKSTSWQEKFRRLAFTLYSNLG